MPSAATLPWCLTRGTETGAYNEGEWPSVPPTQVAVPAPSATPWTLTARWVFPVSAAPLERGLVTIAGERILAVEPSGARRADLDLGDMAILPGLVNAHTHLDLSGLRGRVPFTGDFIAWLRAVIDHRRQRSAVQVEEDVRAGLAESISRGVTLLADIAAGGHTWPLVSRAPLRAVVFHELLGLSAVRAGQSWAGALAWLRDHPATDTCRPGLSPHAPYSVRSSLFRAAVALAAERGLPLTIHLAETREELQLLESRAGPFVPFLEALGVWDAEGLVRDPEEVVRPTAAAPHALFAHGNYLDVSLPLPPTATVVYCPRTHAYFRHPPHAFRALLAGGVRVALGTDSLASNPDLDVLAEARFLHRQSPDVPGALLLHLVTLAGAEALGLGDSAGSLTPGKSADLVAVPLPSRDEADPHDLVLGSDHLPARVLWRGRWTHAGGNTP